MAEPSARKRVLFLFSDTGGGHRSATLALIEALGLEFPDTFDCKMVDVFRDYLPAPLRYAPEMYPPMTKFPRPGRSRTAPPMASAARGR